MVKCWAGVIRKWTDGGVSVWSWRVTAWWMCVRRRAAVIKDDTSPCQLPQTPCPAGPHRHTLAFPRCLFFSFNLRANRTTSDAWQSHTQPFYLNQHLVIKMSFHHFLSGRSRSAPQEEKKKRLWRQNGHRPDLAYSINNFTRVILQIWCCYVQLLFSVHFFFFIWSS